MASSTSTPVQLRPATTAIANAAIVIDYDDRGGLARSAGAGR
ncbi:hypothetical protein [Mesorhizobium captivum]|nr:hypothetical protein [Mesorhizobium sp. VK3C]MDX8449203.1 hypothetical protein [Mesorhizobium sp. VK3C]